MAEAAAGTTAQAEAMSATAAAVNSADKAGRGGVTPTFSAGKYRSNQPYLFQTVPAKVIKSRLPDGTDLLLDVHGPTHRYVDAQTGWTWTRAGGDWIDAKLVRHGSTPWFSVPVGDAQGATAVKAYSGDVTAALKQCQSTARWCAMLLTWRNAPRSIAGKFHPSLPAPSIVVVYKNGQTATLNCRLVAVNSASASGPNSTSASVPLPAFVEFDRPTAEVVSATLKFTVTEHWSGNLPMIDGFLIDPPVNAEPVVSGLAARAGRLDEGLAGQAPVIGVHRYVDGSVMSDFVHPEPINFGAEKNYDPAIYNNGATDLTKLPHLGLGKWIQAGDKWDLVSSAYRGDGFQALASGLGAMRLAMPAAVGVVDGSVVGSSGTLAGNSMIFLPEALFGRLARIFVRYYFRIGTPYKATQANRKHVYNSPGYPVWTTYAGKFGIAPDHSTATGGVSGSSGGGEGWQMRHAWYDCDAETGGPDEGGWASGYHLYDFYYQNPKGYNYGHGDGTGEEERWGQRGGLGGMLYAGQWYCIETELQLNSLTSDSPGFLPDGVLRTWIDGRLAYQRPGMVFRSAPVSQHPYSPDRVRPCRELGVRGLWLNWFHGGKTLATFDRTSFYTGLAWSQEYIGPMKLS